MNGTQNTHIYDHFFVEVTPENVKVMKTYAYPWILFLIKIQLEMKFLSMKWFEKIKEINMHKSLSERDNTTIEDTF